MLPLLSLSEASALDKALIEKCGLDESSLVSSAALGAYETYKDIFRGKSVLFVVGKGNNGSDALALAALALPSASKVSVYNHFDKGNEENERRKSLLPPSAFVDSPVPSDVIVDGLFGVKCRLPLDERTGRLVDWINSSSSVVLSLDCPSGMLVRADYTITFMCQKREMYYPRLRGNAGRITLFNPGFPPHEIKGDGSAFLLEDGDYSVPSFGIADYKNTRGHVTVVGGSEKYPGAAVLSSLAAFHAGAGKVSVLSSPSVRNAVLSSYPSIMVTDSLFQGDSFVVGPGWGEGDRKLLEDVTATGKPFVVDADGIKHLGGLKLSHRAVITPHIGEYTRLCAILGIEKGDIEKNIRGVALTLECVVVLKSSTVLITDGDVLYVCDGANPSLGVAGSGDVLAGITGAFLASGMNPLLSAVNAVILHQRSGREAERMYGFYSAENLVDTIGRLR
jgi:ADP-dependent NAD(P)H-hydrate dehydratase / NAD(P)H-hydrate epimerase